MRAAQVRKSEEKFKDYVAKASAKLKAVNAELAKVKEEAETVRKQAEDAAKAKDEELRCGLQFAGWRWGGVGLLCASSPNERLRFSFSSTAS
jgi:hypothetical protein